MERWRDIPEWSGYYAVSTSGRVRSITRSIQAMNPQGRLASRIFQGRFLVKTITRNGYETVSLTAPKRKRQCAYVHALVLNAWRGARPDNFECCHRNGIRTDNRLCNLRYGTKKSNAADRKAHGKPYARGTQIAASKLKPIDVISIVALSKTTRLSHRKIAAKFGVSHSTIGNILRKRAWRHVHG